MPLPNGYHHLRHRTRLAAGSFDDAATIVESFSLHRAAGVRMLTDAPRAKTGVRVTVSLGLGPVRLLAPCEIVAVFADEDRRGWAYGTLPGHPECGEEAFILTRDDNGAVFFEVRAFSRPARWFTKLGSPLVPVGQFVYAWHLARTLRRMLRPRPERRAPSA
jgi:uncharacterized protein (UPF0548 family)